MNKKAIVTGGAGFIGSNLCEELQKQNWDFTVIDDFSTGFKENLPKNTNRFLGELIYKLYILP
jgi:nucleoside-diphosphate-sugar epimerase